MSLLSLITALLLEQLHPLASRKYLYTWLNNYVQFFQHHFNAVWKHPMNQHFLEFRMLSFDHLLHIHQIQCDKILAGTQLAKLEGLLRRQRANIEDFNLLKLKHR